MMGRIIFLLLCVACAGCSRGNTVYTSKLVIHKYEVNRFASIPPIFDERWKEYYFTADDGYSLKVDRGFYSSFIVGHTSVCGYWEGPVSPDGRPFVKVEPIKIPGEQ